LFVYLDQPIEEEYFEVHSFLEAAKWVGYGPEENSWHLETELRKDLGDSAFDTFVDSMPNKPVFN